MQRETLRQEYIRLIGYDPFKDSPSITVDEVREILADYKHNVATYADDTACVPDLQQTRTDVDCDPDNYTGWTSMQSAARDNW